MSILKVGNYGDFMKNYSMLLILLLTLSAFTSSCAFMDRRDYQDEMSEFRTDDPMFIAGRDFQISAGDSGSYHRRDSEISSRTPASFKSAEKRKHYNSIKRELSKLENNLNEAQFSEYKKYRSNLGSDSEKIYYLRLSASERREYLQVRNIEIPRFYTVQESRMAAFSNDIILGMRKNDVIKSWGNPERKDFSGDPRYENERWAYSRNGSVKYVYFSGGSVEGWTEQ
jgi:hypothetical protein